MNLRRNIIELPVNAELVYANYRNMINISPRKGADNIGLNAGGSAVKKKKKSPVTLGLTVIRN